MNEVIGKVQGFHSESMGAMTGGLEGLLPGMGGQAGGDTPPSMNRAARRANKR